MRVLWWLLALITCVTLALFQLYPAWLDGAHAVVGLWGNPDMISNHWLYRWVPEQLSGGGTLLHNDRYYVPIGDAPWLAGNGSDAVPYALIAALLPWPGSVTLWAGLTLVLNGLSAFGLARFAGARGAGALVAAAAVAAAPYALFEMEGARFAQTSIFWMGFFLLAWVALLAQAPVSGPWVPDRRSAGLGVAAGLLYGATAFVYWYYGLWAAMLGGLLFLARPRWRALVPFVPVALLTTLPPLLVFLTHWSAIPGAGEAAFPNPLALDSALPFTFPLWGGSSRFGQVTLPLALSVFAVVELVAVVRARWEGGWPRGARGWAQAIARVWRGLPWWQQACTAGAALFYLLALGPFLVTPTGHSTGVPGPFLLLYGLPGPLRRYWWPYRHVVGLAFALAPLAARGADRALGWFARQASEDLRPYVPVIGALVLALTVPVEVAARGGRDAAASSWWSPPAAYQALAKLPGDVILELPIAPQMTGGQQTLSYQWVHGKRLLNGHAMWVDRVRPAAWDAWVAKNGLLSSLQQLEQGQVIGLIRIEASDIDALKEVGLRYLVVNKEYFPGEMSPLLHAYNLVFTALFGEPVLQRDEGLTAWDIDAYTGITEVDPPPIRTPTALRSHKGGGLLPTVGELESLGWRDLPRRFPPNFPEEAVEEEAEEASP